jgi:hypothetical protein
MQPKIDEAALWQSSKKSRPQGGIVLTLMDSAVIRFFEENQAISIGYHDVAESLHFTPIPPIFPPILSQCRAPHCNQRGGRV